MAESANKIKAYVTDGISGDGTFTWLDGEQSNSFNRTQEAIEVSDKSSDWAQFIAGKKGATADITVYAANGAEGEQHKLLASLYAGTSVFVFIGTLGEMSKPDEGDLFEAVITSISETNDFNTVASRSISLQVTGKPVHYPTIA